MKQETFLCLPLELAKILIPVLVTIFLFFIGHIIGWIKNKYEKFKETKEYREMILEWINILENPIKTQIVSCKKFAEQVGSSRDLQPVVLEYNNFIIEKIETIPFERYVKTFVINTKGDKKEKYKQIYNLISQFDYLRNVQKEMLDFYEKYHSYCEELMNEWNTNFINFDTIVEKHTLDTKAQSITTDPFHLKILEIVIQWGRNSVDGQSSVQNSMIHLINPMSDLVSQELKDNPINEYAYSLDICLQGFNITLKKLAGNYDGNKNLFSSISQNMETSLETLIAVKEFFNKKTKVRCLFNIN